MAAAGAVDGLDWSIPQAAWIIAPMSDASADRLPCLRIEPQGWVLPLPAGLSLLEAAQQAGVRLSRSCRNGTCRRCLCRLVDGAVSYRIEWPGLSREEKAEGWILPCVALPEGDVRITAPDAAREIG